MYQSYSKAGVGCSHAVVLYPSSSTVNGVMVWFCINDLVQKVLVVNTGDAVVLYWSPITGSVGCCGFLKFIVASYGVRIFIFQTISVVCL